jgi:hypothetical protein
MEAERAARASVATPGGGWLLGWDPEAASFWAEHRPPSPDGAPVPEADHRVGGEAGSCPGLGALEEVLGFVLPAVVRAALADDRRARPALAVPRSDTTIPEPGPPRPLATYPEWGSPVAVPPEAQPVAYGVRLEQDPPDAVADLGDGTRLELRGGEARPATGDRRVAYRLTHHGHVMFAGEDIFAPADADLTAADAGRALLALVLDPDAPQRTRYLSSAQTAFVRDHGDRLRAAVEPPQHPYPVGTRVAALVGGERVTGVVTYAAVNQDRVLAYSWRPDVAELPGHPHRHHHEHQLASPPQRLAPTLAPPFAAPAGEGVPLTFGAVVALAHPDSGERVEAVVLRAYRDGGARFLYQVQPLEAGSGAELVVAAEECALVRGTWWPSHDDLVAARTSAGLELTPGEVFATRGAPGPGPLPVAGSEPPSLTLQQRMAALALDAGPPPRGDHVHVTMHGDVVLVGDRHHGWLAAPADRWEVAGRRPAAELAVLVREAAPVVLTGGEHPLVLAALAAVHAPGALTAEAGGPLAVPEDPRPRERVGLISVSRQDAFTRLDDPRHGALRVRTEQWEAATRRPPAELAERIQEAAPGLLTGGEHPLVLAALATLHAPHALRPAPAPSADPVRVGGPAGAEL